MLVGNRMASHSLHETRGFPDAFPLAGFGDRSAARGDIGGNGGAGSCGISALRSLPLQLVNISYFKREVVFRLTFWSFLVFHLS